MTEFVAERSPDRPDVLLVSGELDIATVDELVTEARTVMEATSSALRIDVSGVTFVDSTGLGALVRLRNEAEQRDRHLDLVGVRPEVRRVLDLTGLSEIFPDEAEQ